MPTPVPSYREKPPKLLGGVLCLDFVNTVSWRGDQHDPGERLTSYAELLHWAVHAGVLDERAASRLAKAALRRPDEARSVVGSAIELREALARLFLGDGRAADLAVLNAGLSVTASRSSIRRTSAGFEWANRANEDALDRPLHPVLRSAAELLTSGRFENTRSCGDPRCRWLFLDASPSSRRRWCSMKECGNRNKVRRFHRAQRSKRGRRA
jgi:predicted RNA-binding Zn ribbon-like protein